ncbi:MAG: DUF362 domain-containing protein [Anaerolineae bacterium]|nr:DUF362 domain-containing protein [Anaerolineae bacterium]
MNNTYCRKKPKNRPLSRRHFLKLIATGVLAGCAPKLTPQPTDEPAATMPPSPTTAPTDTPTAVLPTNTPTTHPPNNPPTAPPNTHTPTPPPTLTPAPVARPHVLGKVVHTRHAGVWDGGDLQSNAIRQMLDASITQLTGLDDARAAWSALFAPGERIALKVNTIAGASYWTHIPLVTAVADSLQDAGVPAEQIVIFDRLSRELQNVGYALNTDGPGVRCYGTDHAYTGGWTLLDGSVGISDVLLNCDALINIPLLKTHGTSGISFALKNHYGTFDQPGRYHGNIEQALGALNALDAIRDRTRLIIGDALNICTQNWNSAVNGDSLLMSFDPVANDAIGLQLFTAAREAAGGNANAAQRKATAWLEYAASLGLGEHAPEAIEKVEVNLA